MRRIGYSGWERGVLAVVLLIAGCVTTWQDGGSFYRGARTALTVESAPAGAKAFLSNKFLGVTPLATALDCQEEMRRKSRRVSYWVTQPGLSVFLSVSSLGLYVPFSVIPVDVQTSQEPSGAFKDNEFVLRIEADGHKVWTTSVVCGPAPSVSLRAVLERL